MWKIGSANVCIYMTWCIMVLWIFVCIFWKWIKNFAVKKITPLTLNCSQTLLIWFKEIQKYSQATRFKIIGICSSLFLKMIAFPVGVWGRDQREISSCVLLFFPLIGHVFYFQNTSKGPSSYLWKACCGGGLKTCTSLSLSKQSFL